MTPCPCPVKSSSPELVLPDVSRKARKARREMKRAEQIHTEHQGSVGPQMMEVPSCSLRAAVASDLSWHWPNTGCVYARRTWVPPGGPGCHQVSKSPAPSHSTCQPGKLKPAPCSLQMGFWKASRAPAGFSLLWSEADPCCCCLQL